VTKALHNAVDRLSTALGLGADFADDAHGDGDELALGDPYELVPMMWSPRVKELLLELFATWHPSPEEMAAKRAELDQPHMTLRIIAEGNTTARGRRYQAEFRRVLAEHMARLRAQSGRVWPELLEERAAVPAVEAEA
jgi:hypothetical protein